MKSYGSHRRLAAFVIGCLTMMLSYAGATAQQSLRPPPTPPPLAPTPEQQRVVVESPDTPIAPPCNNCYKGFKFDPKFWMGAHFNGSWIGAAQQIKDELHIDITQLYAQPYLSQVFDSTSWDTTDWDINKPETRSIWFQKLQMQFWRNVEAADMKVVMEPGILSAIAKGSEMSEAYFGQTTSDTIQRVVFSDMGTNSGIDRLQNSFIWGGLFPRSQQDTLPLLMAGAPQYTAMGVAQPGYYLANSNMAADSGKYDVSVAIKIATGSAAFTSLNDAALLAYVKLYRRIPVGQENCGCILYEYVDSLAVTKSLYVDSTVTDSTIGNPGNPYRDVTFSFLIPEPTITVNSPINIVLGPGDVVTALPVGTHRKYLPRGGVLKNHPKGFYRAIENDATVSDSIARLQRYCALLKKRLGTSGYYDSTKLFDRPEIIWYGDFGYEVYTTRKVDITFMRGRIAPHTYALLRKEAFKDTIRGVVKRVLTDLTLDTAMRRLIHRFGVVDELAIEKYRGYMDVASRVQRAILDNDTNDTRGIWANPQSNSPSFRVLTGDLDTTAIKMAHMSANQWYNYGGLVPVAHACPDSMKHSPALENGLYRAKDNPQTGEKRILLYNTTEDHRTYTAQTLKAAGETIDQLSQMVNVSRFMFRHIRRESYPVYSVVQVHGYLGAIKDSNDREIGYSQTWHFPIITPEEITVQAWLALNCGVDGLWFSDFTYDDAREFGVMHWKTGNHSKNFYDSLNSGDPWKQNDSAWRLPMMWTGFKDRFGAVKRVTTDFHDNIIPVYQNLDHNGIRMNVWQNTGFAAMPMLDTLYALRAAQFKGESGYVSKQDSIYDPRDSTYMVATIFNPGLADTNRKSRYLLVTNLRCWPYDEKIYSSYVKGLNSMNADTGLGAVDVRKPIIVLKNTTDVIADYARIQRIGDTASRIVAFGTPVPLDWLEPGWGAMYRITPIVRPVSALGTAYNNAVHSINPSSDNTARDRIFVYERDSIVYLRAMDSNGTWGLERMISKPADTATITVNGRKRNKADNMLPAIDMIRGGGNSCAIVWERHDNQTDSVTVEMAWLASRPTRKSFPSDTIHRRLLSPRKFVQSWMRLTPAITGVDSGYIVAWAAPDYTVEAIAVRDNPSHGRVDTSRVLRMKMLSTSAQPNPVHPDSATAYPTLAYVRNWGPIAMNNGILSGPDNSTAFTTMPVHIDTVADTIRPFHMAHLAYAQGKRNAPNAFSVIYHRLGATFPPLTPPIMSSPIPRLWASPGEHVSSNVFGCNHTYPSISADSQRVAVTFTVQAQHSDVYLRFRDNNQSTIRHWITPMYVWGSNVKEKPRFRDYERSSVTMFPDVDRDSSYMGALTWQWTNPGGGRKNGVKFYRFGQVQAETLPDGQHPTMMLVPALGASANRAMSASGIFRRGADASQFQERRQRGDTGVYYPGYFDNTPISPIISFSSDVTDPDTILAEGTIERPLDVFRGCETVNGGIKGGLALNPLLRNSVDTIPSPGMPPSFFPASSVGSTALSSPADLSSITRTATFRADTAAVTIDRITTGNSALLSWLNSEPNDAVTGAPANIIYSMQIVRDSDNVVLWTGDTLSARAVAADTIAEEITLPVQSVATPGTKVHIRLVTATTNGLAYSMKGSFNFGGGGGAPAAKRILSPAPEPLPKAGEAIGVKMIPNPLHTTSGELRIIVPAPGSASVAIYDMLGNKVLTLPPVDVKRAGEYALPVDLSELREGTYIVEVRSGGSRGSTRITLIR